MKLPRTLLAVTFLTGLLSLGPLVGALVPAAQASELSDQRVQVREIAAQVAALDLQLEASVARYAEAAQDLDYLQRQIGDNQKELDFARVQLRLAGQDLDQRAEALYKQGSASFLDVVLGSSSFDELLVEVDYFRRVGRRDADIVAAVERHGKRVAAQREQLEADLAKAKSLTDQRARERAAVEAALGDREALLKGVRAKVLRLQDALRQRADEAAAGQDAASSGGGTATPGGLLGEGVWWPLIQEVAKDNGVSADGLYRLMMAESGGVANASNGVNKGLFQYADGTWMGSWNPWRASSIFDGAAQIRATGLAIKLGYGPGWWSSTYSWAFSGN